MIMLGEKRGLEMRKPPKLLAVEEESNILIRQADSYKLKFTMMHYKEGETYCWLATSLSDGHSIVAKVEQDSQGNFECIFNLS